MLERMLRRWRFERVRALLLEGSVRFAFWPAALLLGFCWADAWISLPQQVRYGAFVLGCGAFLWGVFCFYVRPISSLNAFDIFRVVGERHPAVRAHLAPAWELARFGPGPHVSSELAAEHVRRTEGLLSSLPKASIFPLRPARLSLRRLSAVAAAWFVGFPWLHDGASLARVLSPWRDVRLEALLTVRPGSARLAWGSAVDIEASWREGKSEAPALWIRSEGVWQKADWDSEGSKFSYRIDSLSAPIEYQLRHKDMSSAVYALTPVPFAHLTELRVRVQLPGHRPPQEFKLENGAEIAALRGSWVTLSGRSDRSLAAAELDASFLGPVRMRQDSEGRWSGSFPLNEAGTLKLGLLSTDGMRDPNPVPFPLKALEDQAPAVELLSPSFELEISPRERLPLTFEARDDYGLSSLWLLYRVGNAPEAQVPIKRLPQEPTQLLGDYQWDLSRLDAGAMVEFQVKALDNASPKPQAGYSRKGMLRLVDFESGHARTVAQWSAAQAALESLARQERGAAQSMRTLAQAPPEARDALTRGWSSREGEVLREWDASGQALSALAASMRDDPYANPGMTQAAEAAGQSLGALRSGELARAQQSAKSADFESAARIHDRLSSRVRRAAETLKEGQETQALQDMWAQSQRMGQAGSEISESLDQCASGGKAPTQAERRKLAEALANLAREMEALEKTISSLPKAETGSVREKNRKVYVVPLQSARRTLDSLGTALERGDYGAAAGLARQLAQQLAGVRSSISEAAKSQVAEDWENPAAKRMEQALDLWKEAVEGQSRSLQMTRAVDERRMKALMAEQEKLLGELAALQKDALREAAELGAPVPAEAVGWMQRVLKEFESGQVEEAPRLLAAASARLKAQAAAIARPAPEQPPPSAARLDAIAAREDEIQSRLAAGVKAPQADEADFSERMADSAVQRQVRRKTEELGRRLDALAQDGAPVSQDAIDAVFQAQPEQRSGEDGLNQGDVPGALAHQGKALELLEQGLQGFSQACKRQQGMEQSSLSGFSGPRGVARPMGGVVRGRTGADTNFVPLPKSQDYQPPREMREEIERSLRERRPGAFDEIIREYLKKMSE